jgi:hypothetical protein
MRSGGRSAIAVNMLAKAGFTNVYNVIDGMEATWSTTGSANHGKRMKNGWKNSGSPGRMKSIQRAGFCS